MSWAPRDGGAAFGHQGAPSPHAAGARNLPDSWFASSAPGHAAGARNQKPTKKYLSAIEHGEDADSLYQLGLEYLRGKKLTQNTKLAAHYLRLASARSHARAEYVMAILHKTGEGVLPSAHKYVLFLQRASRHGLPVAQLELGVLNARGFLVPKDLQKAKKLLLTAGNCGETGAWKELVLVLGTQYRVHPLRQVLSVTTSGQVPRKHTTDSEYAKQRILTNG